MKLWPILAFLVALVGCDAKIGNNAQLPAVAIYPGAKIISNGENSGVIGANLTTNDPAEKVIDFYAKDLGVPSPSGRTAVLKGTKGGHSIQIIIGVGSTSKTAVSIVERK